VDFFFVLSGFIIYWSSEGKTVRAYAGHRLRRIYIPYLPIGLAIAALYLFIPTAHKWGWLATLTLLPVQSAPALTVAWTLQHEIFFYAVFGMLYFTGWLRVGLAVWAVLILTAWSFGLSTIPLALINLEFLFGIAAAVAVKRGFRVPMWPALPILALWLAFGADRGLSVMVGLALAFVIAGAARADLAGRLKTPRTLIFLGAASYSIYLVHNPALSLQARVAPGNWMIALPLTFLAATVAGCAYHLIYERPALRLLVWPRQARPSRPPATPAMPPLP
jgi:peptidoglycan/LPS O-acetylase OafA/YrhL